MATTAGGTGGEIAQHPVVVRELGETPKPPGKPAGKRAKDKSKLHSCIFDYLEKEVPEEDPLEFQFISMAKHAKAELPGREAFRAALKLTTELDDYIEQYERKQIVASMQYNDNQFLNSRANQVNVNPIPGQVNTLQLQTQPPALQHQPPTVVQLQPQHNTPHYAVDQLNMPRPAPTPYLQQQPQVIQGLAMNVAQGDDAVLDRVLNFQQV